MNATKILKEVDKEMKRKYSPEHQLCDMILKNHPELKKYLK